MRGGDGNFIRVSKGRDLVAISTIGTFYCIRGKIIVTIGIQIVRDSILVAVAWVLAIPNVWSANALDVIEDGVIVTVEQPGLNGVVVKSRLLTDFKEVKKEALVGTLRA